MTTSTHQKKICQFLGIDMDLYTDTVYETGMEWMLDYTQGNQEMADFFSSYREVWDAYDIQFEIIDLQFMDKYRTGNGDTRFTPKQQERLIKLWLFRHNPINVQGSIPSEITQKLFKEWSPITHKCIKNQFNNQEVSR